MSNVILAQQEPALWVMRDPRRNRVVGYFHSADEALQWRLDRYRSDDSAMLSDPEPMYTADQMLEYAISCARASLEAAAQECESDPLRAAIFVADDIRALKEPS